MSETIKIIPMSVLAWWAKKLFPCATRPTDMMIQDMLCLNLRTVRIGVTCFLTLQPPYRIDRSRIIPPLLSEGNRWTAGRSTPFKLNLLLHFSSSKLYLWAPKCKNKDTCCMLSSHWINICAIVTWSRSLLLDQNSNRVNKSSCDWTLQNVTSYCLNTL
jgi:hypothetical protein